MGHLAAGPDGSTHMRGAIQGAPCCTPLCHVGDRNVGLQYITPGLQITESLAATSSNSRGNVEIRCETRSAGAQPVSTQRSCWGHSADANVHTASRTCCVLTVEQTQICASRAAAGAPPAPNYTMLLPASASCTALLRCCLLAGTVALPEAMTATAAASSSACCATASCSLVAYTMLRSVLAAVRDATCIV